MLISDQEIFKCIDTNFSAKGKEVIVVDDIEKIDENTLDLEKPIFLRNLNPHRQTNAGNFRLMCEALNADGSNNGDKVYRAVHDYNSTYTKAFLGNHSNWTDLKAFNVACNSVKELFGNRNPRAFLERSKYSAVDKGFFESMDVQLLFAPLRTVYEFAPYKNRDANYDFIFQFFNTEKRQIEGGATEFSTLYGFKYFENFMVNNVIGFEHEWHVFGIWEGLAGRKKRPFGNVVPHHYAFKLLDVLKNDYGYLNLQLNETDSPDRVVLLDGKQLAHDVALMKKDINCSISPVSRLLVKSFRKTRSIFDYSNPKEISSFDKDELSELIKTGRAMIVRKIDRTVEDQTNRYKPQEDPSRFVVKKGEFFDALYGLAEVVYRNKPVMRNRLDYGYADSSEEEKSLLDRVLKENSRKEVALIRLFEEAVAGRNEVRRYADHLEELVDKKTKQLSDANNELIEKNKIIEALTTYEVAGQLAHTINNKATGLLYLMDSLMEERKERGASLSESVRDMERSISMLFDSFNDFIDLASPYVGHMEEGKVRPVIESILKEKNAIYKMISGKSSIPLVAEEEEDILSRFYGTLKLISEITRRVRAYASMESKSSFSNFDLGAKVEEVFASKKRAIPPEISLSLQKDYSGNYYGNPKMIEVVLDNLLTNSVKFGGKNVSVRVYSGKPEGCESEGVIIEVKDDGSGIKDSVIGYIFEPFFSTDTTNSTGIGLDHVRRGVEAHKGYVKVKHTEVGRGTTFEVYLPLAAKSERQDR